MRFGIIKLSTSPNNRPYILLHDKDGFKKMWNDEIVRKLKDVNIQTGSYISVIVPITKTSTKKTEAAKNIIEIAQLDNKIEQKIDLKIKKLLLEKHIDLAL